MALNSGNGELSQELKSNDEAPRLKVVDGKIADAFADLESL